MRILLSLALLLLPLPALAEAYACTLGRICDTGGGGCADPGGSATFTLSILDDGQTATLSTLSSDTRLTLLESGSLGRTFLLRDGDTGLGLLTLRPDGALVASSNELNLGGLIGTTAQGTCTAEAN